jgi:glycosyltransferase involved in cell wall biosynthesis
VGRIADYHSVCPVVSVILAVYNGERYIAEAVSSILNQTLSNFELIVINDGSTDGTSAILEQLRLADPRVRVLHEARIGFAAALNLGVSQARGEFIARMDGDDVSAPTRLATQLRFLRQNSDVAICGSAVRLFGSCAARDYGYPSTPASVRCHLLFQCCLCHPATMIRRSIFTARGLRYRAEFAEACDYDLWALAAWEGHSLDNVPEVLLDYRQHEGQVTRSTGQRQLVAADRIRLWQLQLLGIEPTMNELSVHSALGCYSYPRTRDFVIAAQSWLEKLLQINERRRLYPDSTFRSLLATHWYSVCAANRGLGAWIVRQFRSSVLGRARPLRFLKLVTHCLRG